MVEWAAGELFRPLGMVEIADDGPDSVLVLHRYAESGRAFVAVDADRVVGYLLLDRFDCSDHIHQVSVDPAFGRLGHGRALIGAVDGPLTLTTFRDVPWNAPYYTRLGFIEIPDALLGPELRAVRAQEAARGLDRWPRLAMRRV